MEHLRSRAGAEPQRTTTVELFFDLVYVFAVTQLSHLILSDLTLGGLGKSAFLLVVVWWAWIYTAWMTNWFDPASPAVRTVLSGAMLASLLVAAALPGAFDANGPLFAGAYVTLQVGRNLAAMTLLERRHHLRDVYERVLAWSLMSGVLWLAGATAEGDSRLWLWVLALTIDLAGPLGGYWLPQRGRATTSDYDIEGRHFTERCQLFILIALGESVVLAGATATDAGLSPTTVLSLTVAFLQTVGLWWLYFGTSAERIRAEVISSRQTGRLARDAYTYAHLLIVAGIVLTAAGTELLLTDPHASRHGVANAITLGGPAIFLLGATLFHRMTRGRFNRKRFVAAALLVALLPLAPSIPPLALTSVTTLALAALAVWELDRPIGRHRLREAGEVPGVVPGLHRP